MGDMVYAYEHVDGFEEEASVFENFKWQMKIIFAFEILLGTFSWSVFNKF